MPGVAALLALALLALGCGSPARPNLLLIVSDTLRADALSCYGGSAKTPNVCRLAARGALFERAYSAAPWTLPSVIGIFTGSHPGGWSDAALGAEARAYHVGDAEQLLGESLAGSGYAVRFDAENRVTLRANAFQGLRPLASPRRVRKGEDERAVRLERSVEFLSATSEPFALVRWFLDPHAPYAPPPDRLAALAPLAEGLPHPLAFYASLGQRQAAHRLLEYAPSFTPAERRLLRALYDAEVEWMDALVGRLLDVLERRGLWDRTVVVFAADHGEAFGEHGLFLHGRALTEQLIHVPLLIAGPGVTPGTRVTAAVSLTSLAPTLQELLGAPPLEGAQGRSFAGLLRGETESAPRAVYAGSPKESGNGLDALIVGDLKLVALPDGSFRLFDLEADPAEQRDLSAERPEDVARLRRRLEALRAENEARRRRHLAERTPAELETDRAETHKALRALGYVE